MSPNIWSKFIECECSNEGIMVSSSDEKNDTLDLAFFRYGNTYKMSLKDKFRYCFQVLFKDGPFIDQVILNTNNAKELIKELRKFVKKDDKKSMSINLGN